MILKEYEENPDRLAYLLPFAYSLEETIMINKNGSLQSTFKFRGSDLDSSTKNELIMITQRVNNCLKRLGDDWSFHVEARRIKSKEYKKKEGLKKYPVFLIELERESFFESGHHYESEYYFTLNFLPPADNSKNIAKFFFKKSDEIEIINNFQDSLKSYKNELENIYSLLKECFKEMKILSTKEMITYYHSCVSDNNFEIKVPEIPILLDNYITDCNFVGGLEPKLGENFIKVVSILNFPGDSVPGIFDSLNRASLEYRWVTRFLTLDKITAKKILDVYFRKWFASRKTVAQMIKEMITKDDTQNLNIDALNKANEIQRDKTLVEEDSVGIGYYTTSIILSDKNKYKLEKKCLEIKHKINSLGFIAEIESYNSVEAWLGSIPGNTTANIRRPLLNTLSLAHLLPISAVWAGKEWNKHLNEPALLYTQTTGNTPFRINLHYGQVGHSLIVGPTGAGKSVHLAFLTAQWMKYDNAQIFAFDKGASTRALTKAIGGEFYDLGTGNLVFQPLANCDNEKEREWCQEWLEEILEAEMNIQTIGPEKKQFIWGSLEALSNLPKENRTLSSFVALIGGQNKEIKEALSPFTGKGPYAKYFDGNKDSISNSNFQVFEMEKIAESKNAIGPALSYLFHKIETEKLNDYKPTLITLDECWLFFDNPKFEAKIREWLKTLRKKNASVVFATQDLSDIANSKILSAVLSACYTRIYLPNPNAMEEENKNIYKTFGLNDREIEIISHGIPQRQYYFKNPEGSRLYELALSPLELAYIATSGEDDQLKCKELYELPTREFNIEWLNYKKFNGKEIIESCEKIMDNV